MLPKVSAALSKFIAPVASSTSQDRPRRELERDPQRRRGQAQRGTPEPKPDPEGFHPYTKPAVNPNLAGGEIATAQASPAPANQVPPLTPAQTLLQLMATLSLKRGISKIFVALAYRSAVRGQKASGRAAKGAVLDHKA